MHTLRMLCPPPPICAQPAGAVFSPFPDIQERSETTLNATHVKRSLDYIVTGISDLEPTFESRLEGLR